MTRVAFTSDTHAWHTNIIRYCNRPFTNAEEMTRTLADNINAVLPANGTLYHCGDFSWGNNFWIEGFRSMINCRNIVLVLGNHDKLIRRDIKLQRLFSRVYYGFVDTDICGQRFTLCHYAMRTWPGSYRSWHLYGHSHGTLAEDPTSYSFDVGVDANNYRPLTLNEVAARMSAKQGRPVDHHGVTYNVES